ncbi:MAG: cation diffusion facilitator family transporter [Thermoanaerobaculaceae bacterium]|nr:cation diffusion facilitator family transporter [Thermoanaerobaculaceae bacterium]
MLSGPDADREKRSAAGNSVLAAVFLTGVKAVVGVTTGSLGILAEAAHSGLDLVAAVVTLFAVRVSGRPADREHTYGHGKVENLSALFEAALLLATCAWIIYEAAQRLLFKTVAIEASAWAFAIMAVSIVVDFTRSRILARVAKKYDSQALEADALHFSTDIYSSAVVILGLVGVYFSKRPGLEWLVKADAVAALGVAAIVVWISVQLGRKTIAVLLDEIPPELRDGLVRAVRVPGVVQVGRLRVRRSGPETFADVTLTVEPDTGLPMAHAIATAAESAARRLLPGADVVVHVEPSDSDSRGERDDLAPLAHRVAGSLGLAAHDIHVHNVLGARSLELHLEVDPALSLAAAHAKATVFERALREASPGIGQIVTHIEPRPAVPGSVPVGPEDEGQVLAVLHELAADTTLHCHPHNVTVHRTDDGALAVSFHCALDPDTGITAAHDLTERVERELRARLPRIGRVVIHPEPLVGQK